jgi:hypothetical protein
MNRFLRPQLARHRTWVLLLVAALVAACASAADSVSPPSPPTAAESLATSAAATSGPRSVPSSTPVPDSPVASAAPSAAPSAGPSSPASGSSATPAPYAIDLFRHGDFVSQVRSDWCVPASILMMARLIDPVAARSMPGQRALDRQARALSSPRLVGAGSEPQGWAAVLNRHGFGRYEVVAFRTRTAALRAAARAIRSTGRPVGLLMWHGAHAWVMSGFTATADPAVTSAFRITSVRVSDPWYPRPTSAFGRTRRPDARLTVAQLATGFLRWRRPLARYAELDGRFVLVLPVAAGGRG